MADNTNTFFGSINLSNASFIVQPSSPSDKSAKIALLGAAIASGRNGGLWNGKGITSPVAAADPIHYTVGLFDNASLAKATYGGLPVDANSLFIATARFGDANLDGKVDALDLNILAAHWQQTSPGLFSDGDFTNDGKVDALDLNLLAANWQFGSAALLADLADLPYARASSPTPVPEPASQILCVIPALLLVRRRLPNRPA